MFCSLRPKTALTGTPTTAKKSTTTIEHVVSRLMTAAKSPAGAQKNQKAIRSMPGVRRCFEEADQKVWIKPSCPKSDSNQGLVSKRRPLVIRNGIDGECHPATYLPTNPASPHVIKAHQRHLSSHKLLHSTSGLSGFWILSVNDSPGHSKALETSSQKKSRPRMPAPLLPSCTQRQG